MWPFQFWIFIASVGIGIALLLAHRQDWRKALLLAMLPLIIYCLVNFTVEAVMFGTWLSETELTRSEYFIGNVNLGICDVKIVLTILALLGWIYVFRQSSNNQQRTVCHSRLPD